MLDLFPANLFIYYYFYVWLLSKLLNHTKGASVQMDAKIDFNYVIILGNRTHFGRNYGFATFTGEAA